MSPQLAAHLQTSGAFYPTRIFLLIITRDYFFHCSPESGEEGGRERETRAGCLACAWGTKPAAGVGALDQDRTWDPAARGRRANHGARLAWAVPSEPTTPANLQCFTVTANFYKLKARPSARRTTRTRLTATLALRGWPLGAPVFVGVRRPASRGTWVADPTVGRT